MGGATKIKTLFGAMPNLIALADEALSLSVGVPLDQET